MAGPVQRMQRMEYLTEVRLGSGSAGSKSSRMGFAGDVSGKVAPLADIALEEIPRLGTGVGELDLVLGGGLVPGSAILVGGEPVLAKVRYFLQTLCLLAETQSALCM